jgi:glycosyltransferase involved in cell wall biosynthesis
MSVSVVMPAYNSACFIEEAIESILCQTYPDFELILINDGSMDKTLEVMETYAGQDSRIRLLSHENMGMGTSLNAAISTASGNWIVRMDADDVMLSHRIERQLQFLAERPDVAVASSLVIYIDEQGRQIGGSVSDLRTAEDFGSYLRSNELLGFHHPASIFRKDVFLKVGGYRPQFWPAEDIDLWNRIAEEGYVVLVQQEYLLKYRVHSRSVSISGAKTARTKVRWVKECMLRRRRGQPEPSLEEFLAIEAAQPLGIRLNRQRKETAKLLYKAAVHYYSEKKLCAGLGAAAGSFLLQPSYFARQAFHKLVHRWQEMPKPPQRHPQ